MIGRFAMELRVCVDINGYAHSNIICLAHSPAGPAAFRKGTGQVLLTYFGALPVGDSEWWH
jgi:hypothetical protein